MEFKVSDEMMNKTYPDAAMWCLETVAVKMAKAAIDDLAESLAKIAVQYALVPVQPKVLTSEDMTVTTPSFPEDVALKVKAKIQEAIGKHLFPEVSATNKLMYELKHELYKSPAISNPHLTMAMIQDAIYKMAHPSSGNHDHPATLDVFMSPADKQAYFASQGAFAFASKPKAVSPAFSPVGRGVEKELAKAIPGFEAMRVDKCPVCDTSDMRLAGAIVHLNDCHKWAREAIADWLETLDLDLTLHPVGGGDKDGSND